MPHPSDRLVIRYKRQLATYGARTSAGLVRAWDRLGSYGEDDVERYAAMTSPIIGAAKVAAVATSVGFFTQTHRIRPAGVKAADVQSEPRIRDPFLALWHAISEGRPNTEALVAGRSMAEVVGLNFVTSTARRASDHAARATGQRVRWERVPDAGACDFCVTVAGQTYLSAESADFGHDRCSCAVVPA